MFEIKPKIPATGFIGIRCTKQLVKDFETLCKIYNRTKSDLARQILQAFVDQELTEGGGE